MARAVWHDRVIAQSDTFEEIEGNVYFPPGAVHHEYLTLSDTHTRCPWKGEARYYHLVVDGARNADAAWFYPDPKPEAARIQDHVAFWRGVRVEP
jgi:uncharacterized protein (DUF427 family)